MIHYQFSPSTNVMVNGERELDIVLFFVARHEKIWKKVCISLRNTDLPSDSFV